MDAWKSRRARNNKSALELLGIKKRKNTSDADGAPPSQKDKKTIAVEQSSHNDNSSQQRRGSLRKYSIGAESKDAPSAGRSNNVNATTPKGRGIPRKTEEKSANTGKDSAQSSTPKRGRGRPKRTANSDVGRTNDISEGNNDSTEEQCKAVNSDKPEADIPVEDKVQEKSVEEGAGFESQALKRGRGRPRKVSTRSVQEKTDHVNEANDEGLETNSHAKNLDKSGTDGTADPPQEELHQETPNKKTEDETPKRGRGRPRKVSVKSVPNRADVVEHNDCTSEDKIDTLNPTKSYHDTDSNINLPAESKDQSQKLNTETLGEIIFVGSPKASQIAKQHLEEADICNSDDADLEQTVKRNMDSNCGDGAENDGDTVLEPVSEAEAVSGKKKRKASDMSAESEVRNQEQRTMNESENTERVNISNDADEELSVIEIVPPRSRNRQRKTPQKYRDFDVGDKSSCTNVITLSPSGTKVNRMRPIPKVVCTDDDGLEVWKIMQMKRAKEENPMQEKEVAGVQVIEIIDNTEEETETAGGEQTQKNPRIELIPGTAAQEMSQEDAVNLLMDVANTSRQRLASSELEGITLSLKELPGDHVEISMEDGTSFQEGEGFSQKDSEEEDNELSYAACEVLSKVAEDVILEPNENANSKVIVVEGVETRKGYGVRQGTLLTWRVQNLDESQQNLTAEELQESMATDQHNSSDTYKVEVTGPEAYDVSRRAKPGRYIILSAEHEGLMKKLEPDDDISNHVRILPGINQNLTLCKYCSTVIQNRHHFRSHIKTHSDVVTFKPWKCPLCDYRANIKAQIGRHINIHGAMKPFICNACGRGFNFRQKLLQHMKYHLDIRDRECPICGLAFHEFKILKHHMKKIHHVTSGFETLKKNAKGIGNDVELQEFWKVKMDEAAKEPNQSSQDITIEVEPQDDAATSDEDGEESIKKETKTDNVETDAQQDGPSSPSHQVSPSDQNSQNNQDDSANQSDMESKTVTLCLQGGKKVEMEMKGGKVVVPPTLVKSHLLNRRHGTFKTSRTIISTEMFRKGFKPNKKLKPTQMKKKFKKVGRKVTDIEALFGDYCAVVPASGVEVSSYYKCKLCTEQPMLFRNKTSFLQHLEKDHPAVKPWKCNNCDFASRLRSGLISHEKQHNPEFSEQCDVCGRSFHDKRKFLAHQRSHLNLREHSCTMCDKRFNERCDMVKHIRRIHATVFPYKCLKCDRAFSERAQLKRHMDQHIGGRRQCEVCHKFYRSQTSLQQHMKSHTCMFHCEICNKSFSSYSGFMAHKVMHDESYEGYKCSVCPQVLLTKGSLKRHLEVVHSKKRDWVCTAENCTKSYKSKKDLMNHMLSHSASMHSCPQCDFKCKRPESIKIHMLRHRNSKPFKCHLCNKEYTQKQALEIHLRHHTGQMEGRCELCGREFLTKYGLMLHMKRRHILKEPAELPSGVQMETNNPTMFFCEECQAVFPSQDKLAIHILAEHMKQDWSTTVSSNQGVAVEVEVDGSSAETSLNTSADATGSVIVVPENASLIAQPTLQNVSEVTTGSSRKYVSLLRNKVIQSPSNTTQQIVPSLMQSEGGENVTVQHVLFDNAQSQKNVATLINPDTNEETLVTISDPQLNQELYVSMPTANFENLLPASSISGNTDLASGQFQETYITINKDGEVIGNSQPMIGEIVTTVLDLETEIVTEMVEEQFVTETVEIPLSIEDEVTTDLTKDAQDSQVVTYNNIASASDGAYVILQPNNPSQLAENL